MDPSSDHEYDYDYNYGFAEMLLLFLLAHATPILDSLQVGLCFYHCYYYKFLTA